MGFRWFLVVVFFLIFAVNVVYVYQHELAHVQVFKRTTCEDAVIGFDFPFAYAECVEFKDDVSEIDRVLEVELNIFNEIVGYNVQTINLTLILCFCGLIFYFEARRKEDGVVRNN